MKIGVIGTGISGLSIANMLRLDHEVTLFEKNIKPGGLIKCERVNDCLFHKVGGHVFNSKNKKVLDWFWSYFDRDMEFVKVARNAKVLFNNVLLGYPIENYLYLLDKPIIKAITSELIALSKLPAKDPFQSEHFEDFLKHNFGSTLYEIYFKPYNEKIWRTDLSKVPLGWLEGKLPMPDLLEIIQSNIIREEEKEMVHSHFYYPKENGSQFIIDRMKRDLNIKTGNPVTTIEQTG
ncbi:MAG TPA: NAD(P)-binding protein, partial [Chitinophagaceae bacterium]|nr:NAD(P)-binding protein [Chitinophagaceae bacterium]